MERSQIETAFNNLSSEVRELSLGTTGDVERVKGPLTPVQFLRNYVLPGRPCIITDALNHWPALYKWSNEYLSSMLENHSVSVHFTPDGRADALVDPLHMLSSFSCPVLDTENVESDDDDLHKSKVDNDQLFVPVLNTPNVESDDDLVTSKVDHDLLPVKTQDDFHTSKVDENLQSLRPQDDLHTSMLDDNSLFVPVLDIQKVEIVDDLLTSKVDHDLQFLRLQDDLHTSKVDNNLLLVPVLDTQNVESDDDFLTSMVDHGLHSVRAEDDLQTSKVDQDLLFVRAHVEKLPFSTALGLIVGGSRSVGNEVGGVAYAQEQNGCFLSEYGVLAADAEVHIPWATEALGCMPEAVNLWIGNQNAVTSFHKDHYENLYAVVAGAKHFTLMPPVDVHRMYVDSYATAQYVKMKDSHCFAIVRDQPAGTVPWVSVDPYSADIAGSQKRFPRFFNGSKPFTCTVRAGEILYLPSMWFHHVRQSPDLEGRTIALNFWYDMQFDIKYAYFNFMESLISVSKC